MQHKVIIINNEFQIKTIETGIHPDFAIYNYTFEDVERKIDKSKIIRS